MTVVACHCIACQRRTGSVFGVAAYYPHDQVKVEGKAKRFDRPTDLGGMFENYFCPECGTNLYFKGSKNPDVTGVAIGSFVDHHDMVPVRSVWEECSHPWVSIPAAQQHFERGRP
jgi:hypothetical protein